MQSDDVFYKNVAAFQNTQDGFKIVEQSQAIWWNPFAILKDIWNSIKRPIYIDIDYTSDDRFYVNNKTANKFSAWNKFKDEQMYSSIHAFIDTANRMGL